MTENMSANDQELRACMASPDFPWGVIIGGDERVVTVVDFKRFAASRGVARLETELDAFVTDLGGRRDTMVDPWSAPSRWLRRLLGKSVDTSDIYCVPRDE